VRVHGGALFRQKTLHVVCAIAAMASVGDISRAQEQSKGSALADSVRSLNQELDRSLSPSRAPSASILAERAARMFELMDSDPQAAIGLSLSTAQAARLSAGWPDAAASIESQGEWHGALTVLIDDDFSHGTSRTRYWIATGGEHFEVYFAGHPTGLRSGEAVSIRGIRLRNRMAAALTRVSAESAPSGCGPTGEQKTAVLLLEFPDVPFPYSIVTPSDLHDMYFSSSRQSLDGYIREASYGQAFVTGDVFGPFQLSQDFDYATQQPDGLFAAIRAADPVVDFTVYNHIVLVWPAPGVSGWGGLGELGCEHLSSPTRPDFIGTFVILGVGTRQGYGIGLAAHEAGHNLGLNHASSLDYAPLALGPPGVDGVHVEYGDPFSVMGGSGEDVGYPAHYNAQHKAQLGWLDSGSMQNVETDGTFVLQPFENPAGLRALRVRRGTGDQWLWLEYRQPIGYDASLAGVGDQVFTGALIHYEDPALIQLEVGPKFYTFLLDFTPNTPHVFSDAALAVGQAWTDPYSSLTIGITSADPSGLKVSVTYSPPCASLTPASRNHGSGAETGTFTVAAPATCTWTATSNAKWITITGGQSGTGSGTVSYSVSANTIPTLIGTPTVRTGSILAGFQTFTVTQASTLTSQPPSLDWVSPNSGSGNSQTFTFSASDPRGAANLGLIEADFVRSDSNHTIFFVCQVTYVINSFTEGNGASLSAGSLYFLTDDQNPSTGANVFTGPYTVGVNNVALQNSECGVDLSGVEVTTSGNSVQMAFPWVFFTAGTWSIQVTLVDNAKNGVGGIEGSWTVPPSPCSYWIGPTAASVGKSETAGTIAVEAGSGCPWVASSSALWIKVTSALSGAGEGAVSYTIAANTSTAARTGTITIAGKSFAITQTAGAAGTAPMISSAGIVNAASNRPGIASATWIAIYGTNLAPAPQTWSGPDFLGNLLPTQLGGVSAAIGGQPAYVYYVSPTQIDVLAPDYLAETVSVEVDTPAGRSNVVTVPRNEFSPGLFLLSQGGAKYVAAVHNDGAYVAPVGLIQGAPSRPARPGEIISLFGTGFGATDPSSPSALLVSETAELTAPVIAQIGGAAAQTSFAGLIGSGLYQFNVMIPPLATGDQPVVIGIGGFQSQDIAYIPVGQ